MFVKVRFESKSLVTATAAETFSARMGLHVSPQVGPVGKGLVAQVAGIGLLARVRAHVTLQQPRPRERLQPPQEKEITSRDRAD